MKTHTTICALLIGSLFTAACKKGKDDPAFTLLTRKQRLAGTWNMTKGTASLTYLSDTEPAVSDYFRFDGSNYQRNETSSGGPLTVYIGSYLLHVTFSKDGKFTMTETLAGQTMTAEGYWSFNSKSKADDVKNKEEITMRLTSVSGDASNNHLFNRLGTEFTYKLTELRNKEITMESSGTIYFGNGEHTDHQSNYTFTGNGH